MLLVTRRAGQALRENSPLCLLARARVRAQVFIENFWAAFKAVLGKDHM